MILCICYTTRKALNNTYASKAPSEHTAMPVNRRLNNCLSCAAAFFFFVTGLYAGYSADMIGSTKQKIHITITKKKPPIDISAVLSSSFVRPKKVKTPKVHSPRTVKVTFFALNHRLNLRSFSSSTSISRSSSSILSVYAPRAASSFISLKQTSPPQYWHFTK